MKLEIEGKPTITNPTQEQIRDALTDLGSKKHLFAVFTNEFGDYLQTTGEISNGFILEYWEKKNKKNYYKSASERHQLDVVVNSFISFSGNPILSSIKLEWESVHIEVSEGNTKLVNAFFFLFIFNVLNLISMESIYKLVFNIVGLIGWIVFIKLFGSELWKPIGENKSAYQDKTYHYILCVVFSIIIALFNIIIALQTRSA